MPGFHGGHDRLQRLRVVGVPSKYLVTQREAVEGHNESDEYLLAIRTVIARVAALCQLVRFRLTFEVSARDIVKQHLVLDRKQLARPPGQMRFYGRLVLKQMIKSTVETVLVDLLITHLQQITERRAPIPVLRDVQFASGFAQSPRH